MEQDVMKFLKKAGERHLRLNDLLKDHFEAKPIMEKPKKKAKARNES